ncbi:MAG TPA: MgtC/SapB family protein [Polyangia bacterium]
MTSTFLGWFTDSVHIEILLRLFAALIVGGIIGIERSHRGRPAGFRTHALVCLSTALLMMVTVYESRWFSSDSETRTMIDPTRMAQGIMTGLGFLGAGAIMRDGATVRGLTTAASIWITAGIGVLIGIGFYFPALAATVITIGTLSVFQSIEQRIPTQFSASLALRVADRSELSEPDLRRLLTEHGLELSSLSYQLDRRAGFFEYSMIVHAPRAEPGARLSEALSVHPRVIEFRLAPNVDS